PVKPYIAQFQALDVLQNIGVTDILKNTVLNQHTLDRRIRQALQIKRPFAPAALEAANHNVAQDRDERTVLAFLIIEIYRYYCFRNLANLNASEVEVLKESAANRIVLESEGLVQAWAIHYTLFCEYISDPAGDFAADGDAAVSLFHLASTNDDVLRRHGQAAAIVIASRLDGDTVVASAEVTIANQ